MLRRVYVSVTFLLLLSANTILEISSMTSKYSKVTQMFLQNLDIYWDGHLKTQCDLINNICYERGIK